MLGLERCFFEPVGESTEAKWHYQPGSGAYRKINSYQFVGVGKGDFVKEERTFGGHWVSVAKGSGSYIRIQTYQHVGLGQGDYDKEEITSYAEWQVKPCCLWLSMALLALLALLAVVFWRPSHVGLSPSYNCDEGFHSWKETWSVSKKQWCCSHGGRGCMKDQLYDCNAGWEDWQRKWTPGQKLWCCTVYSRGCSSSSHFQVKRYDCKSVMDQRKWSLQKQQWCCTNSGIACNLAEHGPAFDCQEDLQDVKSWNVEKRSFCCKHANLGCAFDCNAGYINWEQAWSTEKQRFCCLHGGRGCTKVSHDCSGHPGDWSATKKSYCCEHEKKGCSTPARTGCAAVCDVKDQKHSCQDRISFAARNDFAYQKNACGKAHEHVLAQCDICSSCSIADVACQALPVTKPFDCDAALQSAADRWSSEKKDWCCKNEMKGCGKSFCDNVEELHRWTEAKKAFCCRSTGNGCTNGPPQVSAGSGYTWKHGEVDGVDTWVREKAAVKVKSTPSSHEGHATGSFDCDSGYADFAHRWSTSKKQWCCEQKGLACTGPVHPAVPLKAQHQWQKKEIDGVWTWTQVQSHVTKTYDCTQGLDHASSEKLTYCCEHFGKGCSN